MSDPYVLVVEDEEPISVLIKYNLEKEGYRVDQAFDGDQALDFIDKESPDMIILDWMLPEITGIEVAKDIRDLEYTRDIPIIMLTARSQENDKLKGFDSGVDDYMTKPFSPKELIARIKSVLKRTNPSLLEDEIIYDVIKVDNNRKCIFVENQKLDLTPIEFNFISHLVKLPEKVHTRDSLLRKVWHNDENVETRTVDVCVRRVRSILESTKPGLDKYIKTVRGQGYILEKD